MNDNNNTMTRDQLLDGFGTTTDSLSALGAFGSLVKGRPGEYFATLEKVAEYLAYSKDAGAVLTSDDIGRDIFGIIGGAVGGVAGGAVGGASVGGAAAFAMGFDGDVFGAIVGLIVGGAVGSTTFGYLGAKVGEAEMQELYDYLMSLPKYQELTIAQRMELAQLIKAGAQPWEYQPNGGVPHVADPVNTLWLAFKNWIAPRRDPLVLDLDGDGIETLAINATSNVVFDYDGDGLKTGTGWIKGDDGFVVLDRNGNGTIDNGGELFGDQTLVNGVKAAEEVNCEAREATLGCGFAALSGEDSNSDGVFDARDSSFTAVRIWQDTNSDGISQSTELHTMSELGITSINLTSTTSWTNLNDNIQTETSTYTKTDGTTGEAGNLNFSQNVFYREFTDHLPLTKETLALPDMQGSGMVRMNNSEFKNARRVA